MPARTPPARIARLAAVVVAAVLLTAGCSGAGDGNAVGEQRYIEGSGATTILPPAERGAPPTLAGRTLDGTEFDLASTRGSVVVLNVWASWCPPCRAEARALERVHQATRTRGVAFVGLNTRDQSDAAKAYVRTFGLTYPSVEDPASKLLLGLRDTLPPTATPSTLVLDREGRVAVRVLGQVSELSLRQAVDDVLAERPQ